MDYKNMPEDRERPRGRWENQEGTGKDRWWRDRGTEMWMDRQR